MCGGAFEKKMSQKDHLVNYFSFFFSTFLFVLLFCSVSWRFSFDIWIRSKIPGSEHKFHKARIENWLPIGFERGFPWMETSSYNHRLETCWVEVRLIGTHSSTNNGDDSKTICIPIHKLLEQPWIHFTSLKLSSVLKSNTHHPEWHQSPIEQKPTTISLIINNHSARSKSRQLTCEKTEGSSWTSRVTRKSWTHFSPSFSWLTPET